MKACLRLFGYVLLFLLGNAALAVQYGRFEGTLVVEMVKEHPTDSILKQDLVYIDPAGNRWVAPAGARINGASIPGWAKSFLGGNYDGPYRYAAAIHDVACDDRYRIKTRSWQQAHEAFYHAMLANDVGQKTALLMYGAVYHFGPKWEVVEYKHVPSAELPELFASVQSAARQSPSRALEINVKTEAEPKVLLTTTVSGGVKPVAKFEFFNTVEVKTAVPARLAHPNDFEALQKAILAGEIQKLEEVQNFKVSKP
jgi:hypothetical protein